MIVLRVASCFLGMTQVRYYIVLDVGGTLSRYPIKTLRLVSLALPQSITATVHEENITICLLRLPTGAICVTDLRSESYSAPSYYRTERAVLLPNKPPH